VKFEISIIKLREGYVLAFSSLVENVGLRIFFVDLDQSNNKTKNLELF